MFFARRTKREDEDHERLLEAQADGELVAEKEALSAAQLRELRQARHRRQGPVFALVLPGVALCLFLFGLLAVWHLPRAAEGLVEAAAPAQEAALARPAALAGVVPIGQLVNETGFQIPGGWDVHAAPTTRRFAWDLTLETATPGGRDKPMLLANRMSPGEAATTTPRYTGGAPDTPVELCAGADTHRRPADRGEPGRPAAHHRAQLYAQRDGNPLARAAAERHQLYGV
jgi:hypothetical protein